MKEQEIWCGWHGTRWPCQDPESTCREEVGVGGGDEPDDPGALAVVWHGDYRRQEVWVASGANIGNWYPLGGEFGRPKVWVDPRSELEKLTTPGGYTGADRPPPGQVPLHPTWSDVLDRGPVTVLTAGDAGTYALGWANGIRAVRAHLDEALEDLQDRPEAGPDER